MVTTAAAPTVLPSPTVMSPSTVHWAPSVTLDPMVGWRFCPAAGAPPPGLALAPSVTPCKIYTSIHDVPHTGK